MEVTSPSTPPITTQPLLPQESKTNPSSSLICKIQSIARNLFSLLSRFFSALHTFFQPLTHMITRRTPPPAPAALVNPGTQQDDLAPPIAEPKAQPELQAEPEAGAGAGAGEGADTGEGELLILEGPQFLTSPNPLKEGDYDNYKTIDSAARLLSMIEKSTLGKKGRAEVERSLEGQLEIFGSPLSLSTEPSLKNYFTTAAPLLYQQIADNLYLGGQGATYYLGGEFTIRLTPTTTTSIAFEQIFSYNVHLNHRVFSAVSMSDIPAEQQQPGKLTTFITSDNDGDTFIRAVSGGGYNAEDPSTWFAEAFAIIDEERAKGKVLISCTEGVSRSASLTIAYLMKRGNLTYARALYHVYNQRPCVEPCRAFETILVRFDQHLQAIRPTLQP